MEQQILVNILLQQLSGSFSISDQLFFLPKGVSSIRVSYTPHFGSRDKLWIF
jgi:hypothetical protein